jgi:subtilisin family serine protease
MKLTPWLSHGTHVAGIIAAERGNGVGVDGIADHVLIMPIVATTATGDERDKDVANAIRYAVANGARVINMSFSKTLSQYKSVVDDAIRYAEEKDVLIVHAAGNDGEDDDSWPHYPIADYETGGRARNVITVGWSRSKFDERLAHPFSDYGARTVDVFAPGSDIFSTVPDDKYGYKSASSMSAAMVTGVAALLLSYFPRLTAVQAKNIIMSSSFKPTIAVNKPGTKQKVSFRSLSVSGGIVNAHNAVLTALHQ